MLWGKGAAATPPALCTEGGGVCCASRLVQLGGCYSPPIWVDAGVELPMVGASPPTGLLEATQEDCGLLGTRSPAVA